MIRIKTPISFEITGILTGFLIVLAQWANAQENAMLFLALNNGDTIQGEYSEPKIRFGYRTNANLTLAQKFVLTDKITQAETEYALETISAVHLFTQAGEEIFRPKELDIIGYWGIDLFLAKEMIEGPVSLYEIRIPRKFGSSGFGIGGLGFKIRGEDNRTLILERGDYCTMVKRTKFRRDFADYFFGLPELVQSIRTKELGYDDLNVIVRKYNEFKSGKTDLVGYTDGLIELLNGTKLAGKLKVYNSAKSCRKFRFVDNLDRPVQVSNKLVHSYQRANEHYRKHELINGSDTAVVYLLQVVSGPVSLFRFTSDLQVKYHKKLPTIEYGEVYKFYFEKEDEFTAIDEKNFHEEASKYFSDAPKLATRIEKRELGYNDLIPILQIYAREISQ
jgi:hypothetical protein